MGQVWLAEQTMPIRRKVALKLIKGGRYGGAVLQRFELERQALACHGASGDRQGLRGRSYRRWPALLRHGVRCWCTDHAVLR
jgi:hypothetical protein